MTQNVTEPGTAEELAKVLAQAQKAGQRVVVRGGGTKSEWGNVPSGVKVEISTLGLSRIVEHAAGDMTATVQAGCTVGVLNRALAERGQRLAIDPLWADRATIGGILAVNDSGALRATYGSLRDHLIGVTVALADGTLAKSGGKVVKNVAGYDLPKLMIGSFGTLGVMTEATFRLYPMAQVSRTLHFGVASAKELSAVLVVMAQLSALTTGVQFEVAAGALPRISVLVEGLSETIESKCRRIVEAAVAGGALETTGATELTPARESLFEKGASVAKINVLPSQWPAFLERLQGVAAQQGVEWKVIGQWFGLGLVSLHGPELSSIAHTVSTLREQFNSLTILQCPVELKQQVSVWPDGGSALPLMRRVKEQFDPTGTLAPGRFVGGI